MNKTSAIKNFLTVMTHQDLASLYSHDMEVQVNVAEDGGRRLESDFRGKLASFTDDITIWKSFRIPYNSFENPEYTDAEIKFDLAEHVEAIGLTGFNWKDKVSKWVGFDFDSLINHTKTGLSNKELEEVKNAASNIDWVTVRKSTSGHGIHFYIFLDDVPTNNHKEHAALARSILGTLSALTGFNFNNKIDSCGGILWVWHRKMGETNGLTLIKQGTKLYDIPDNWRDHLAVVEGKRRKILPQIVEDSGVRDLFEELTSQESHTPLDVDHKRLINYLKDNDFLWWFDQDHHMLVTHTKHLEDAHNNLNLKGYFKTNSSGKDLNTQNCFASPNRHGSWIVRRYGQGVQEDPSWIQDGQGWTHCYLNKNPDLQTACRIHGGIEDPKGGYVFREAEMAIKTALSLGINIDVPTYMRSRKTKLKHHKDGRLLVEIVKDDHDNTNDMPNWLPEKGNWIRIYHAQVPLEHEDTTNKNYDDIVRHLVTESNEDAGWRIRSDEVWRCEPLTHVRPALSSLGLNGKDISLVLGTSILKCWKMVNKPFSDEYSGNREWNINAAQLRYTPSTSDNLKYPTWLKILQHCGSGLDEAIKQNDWCKQNNILTGGDYLKIWVASMFQEPIESLPYLFFYGPQKSGKSIFHESLSLLFTKGYKRADAALISQQGFNSELEGAILCVVEETDLQKNKAAYNRIKDWTTSKEIPIHAKFGTPYHSQNSTHWVQCANDHHACPPFIGDTRITMCYVEPLTDIIPRKQMDPLLEQEASDFLAELFRLELPKVQDRLNIPIIITNDKTMMEQLNKTPLELFIDEKCVITSGQRIKFSDFYDEFVRWSEVGGFEYSSKIKVGRDLPPQFIKGRNRKDAQFYIGNIWWKAKEIVETTISKYVLRGEFLDETY